MSDELNQASGAERTAGSLQQEVRRGPGTPTGYLIWDDGKLMQQMEHEMSKWNGNFWRHWKETEWREVPTKKAPNDQAHRLPPTATVERKGMMGKPKTTERKSGAAVLVQRLVRPARPLSEYDEKVLRCITTERPEGIPNFHIMQWDFGGGRDISQSLQKLKRRGLAIIVRRHHGITYWRATGRPNDQAQRPALAKGKQCSK